MRILQINTYDIGGGRAPSPEASTKTIILWAEETLLSVGRQYGDDTHVVQIEKYPQCEIDKTAQPYQCDLPAWLIERSNYTPIATLP